MNITQTKNEAAIEVNQNQSLRGEAPQVHVGKAKRKYKPSEKTKQARAALMTLSRKAGEYRKQKIAKAKSNIEALAAASMTINSIVLSYYQADNQGATEWNTFKQWKEQGYSVKKGEKAFYIWGAPRRINKKDEHKQEGEISADDLESKAEFWPLCALFNNLQVEKGDSSPKDESNEENKEQEADKPTAEIVTRPVAANSKQADKFRSLADKMTTKINDCFTDRLTNTPKRLAQAESKRNDGYRLERTQKALYALATLSDVGKVPAILSDLKTKGEIFDLLGSKQEPVSNGYHTYYRETGEPSRDSQQAHALWALLSPESEEDKEAEVLRHKVNDLQFCNIAGYFPTPASVIEQMLEEAEIEDSHKVCEPSAGSGDILDAIKRCSNADIEAFEINYTLMDILKGKGHRVEQEDFLQVEPEIKYDRILMNPPFENLQDIEHIQHAYKCLKAGGRLVAICSPSGFFRSGKKAEGFRLWFEEVRGSEQDLPENSFKASGTAVNTKIVIIDKLENEEDNPNSFICDDYAERQEIQLDLFAVM